MRQVIEHKERREMVNMVVCVCVCVCVAVDEQNAQTQEVFSLGGAPDEEEEEEEEDRVSLQSSHNNSAFTHSRTGQDALWEQHLEHR